MKRWSAFATAMLFVGVAAFSYSQQASGQTDAGWVTLFDGKSLDNWTQIGDANWKLADGVVAADKGNGFLVSKDSYGDFQIRAEFWVDDEANSGIFIRCTDPAKVTAKNAYEVNIFDKRPDPSYGTGAIVDTAKAGTVLKAGGKWNVYEMPTTASTRKATSRCNTAPAWSSSARWRSSRCNFASRHSGARAHAREPGIHFPRRPPYGFRVRRRCRRPGMTSAFY